MKRPYILLLLLFAVAATIKAQAPAGYYNNAANKTGEALLTALHDIIKNDDHLSYSGLWEAYQTTDLKPNSNYIWDIYSNCNFVYGTGQCG